MFISEIKSKPEEDISILISFEKEKSKYIVDCGLASNLTRNEILKTNAIFISHAHVDHFINFDAIFRHQIDLKKTITVCGPLGISKQIQSKFRAYTWNLNLNLEFKYQIHEITDENNFIVYEIKPPLWEITKVDSLSTNTIFETQKFKVSYAILDHGIPSIAYKFVQNNFTTIKLEGTQFQSGRWIAQLKHAHKNHLPETIIETNEKKYKAKDLFYLLTERKGNSLGVIMDHAASEANHEIILKHFKYCDTVFIESYFMEKDEDLATAKKHSYSKKSAEIMKKAMVEKAIPMHFSRRYQAHEIEVLIKEFNTIFHGTT